MTLLLIKKDIKMKVIVFESSLLGNSIILYYTVLLYHNFEKIAIKVTEKKYSVTL